MPKVSHRIDLVVVSVEPELLVLESVVSGLQQRWEDNRLLLGDQIGDDPNGLISGGFKRLWLDQPGRMMLYANQQGGFRVSCPQKGGNIAKAFETALRAWRKSGPRSLVCPVCHAEHPLEACTLSPPGVFGSSAIVFSDVGGVQLTGRARADLLEAIGPFHVVLRRVT